jgi:ABC-2 type transport system ATP-binding protein
MNILKIDNLTKKFKDFTAVDKISFSLKEGEILGLLGPNGAGKTTTIQMLLGVMTPTSGKIAYFNKPFNKKNRSEIMQQINFSSTYISLPWRETVMQSLKIFAKLYNIPNRKKRIEKLISSFECEEFVNKSFSSISAGEKTRALLAKAFLNYPKIILLDEPTASLDPDIAKKIREFLLKEKKEFNVSILITSHNMNEVEEICDRVIFLNHGKIITENTPSEIAKNIKDTVLKLLITKNQETADNYFKKMRLKSTKKGVYTSIEIKEDRLPEIISDLSKNNVIYKDINIIKPDLEDFFLEMLKNEHIKN